MVDGHYVAFNSLTGEFVELTAKEYDIVNSEIIDDICDAEHLIKKYFLVPLEHDDIQLADEVRSFLDLFEKKEGYRSYTIFTTMACNARCFYCYEFGRPQISMSLQTANDVAEFIKKTCKKNKKIRLAWFGGEPLCNSKVIDVITQGLKNSGIEFMSVMTTNGYLFDKTLAEKAAKDWKLERVQITLDGTEENYNRIKAYVNAEGVNPFVKVTDNIEFLLKQDISVNVRVNLGMHNKDDLLKLADWLAVRYAGYEKLCVYATLLFDTDFKKQILGNEKFLLTKELLAFQQKCFDAGIRRPPVLEGGIKSHACMADSYDTVTITPDGHLGKCEHFSEDEYIGDIYTGVTNVEKENEFKEKANTKDICTGCSVYPVCIKLKKCPNNSKTVCDSEDRLIKETQLHNMIEYTFRHLRKQKEN